MSRRGANPSHAREMFLARPRAQIRALFGQNRLPRNTALQSICPDLNHRSHFRFMLGNQDRSWAILLLLCALILRRRVASIYHGWLVSRPFPLPLPSAAPADGVHILL